MNSVVLGTLLGLVLGCMVFALILPIIGIFYDYYLDVVIPKIRHKFRLYR